MVSTAGRSSYDLSSKDLQEAFCKEFRIRIENPLLSFKPYWQSGIRISNLQNSFPALIFINANVKCVPRFLSSAISLYFSYLPGSLLLGIRQQLLSFGKRFIIKQTSPHVQDKSFLIIYSLYSIYNFTYVRNRIYDDDIFIIHNCRFPIHRCDSSWHETHNVSPV